MEQQAADGPEDLPPTPGLRLAIAAILRNEGPYLLEWIAWHRALGIDRFFLADNLSDDGSGPLFAALDAAGIASCFAFPGTPGAPPQLPAYAEILARFGAEADWIAFIDADEFLLPAPPARALLPLVAALDRPEVGAIAVNWAVYGSAGELRAREGLVTERFPARAGREAPLNLHYKTILRPAAFAGTHHSPHLFRLRPDFAAVHADGGPVEAASARRHGLSRRVVWAPLRLNHYVVKSRAEFFERKLVRGRATQNTLRDAAFFEGHDRNEARDPAPPWLVAATRAEKARLLARLAAAGWAGPEPALDHLAVPPPRAGRRTPWPFRARPRASGRLDRIAPAGQVLRVTGWALDAGGAPMAAFLVRAGDAPAPLLATARLSRTDVADARSAAGLAADPGCGFALDLAWEPLEVASETGAGAPVSVTALDAAGRALALAPDDPRAWADALARARAAYAAVPEAPRLPPEGADALRAALGTARGYLEYGAGGSTLLAVARGLPLVSAESDRLWLDAVETHLAGRLRPERQLLAHIDIGPVGAGGRPAAETAWRRFPTWALEPWRLAAARGLAPDLVLIDGPFRRACLLAALLRAPAGACLLFPDYAARPGYRLAEDLAPPPRLLGRMAEFAVPDGPRPADALWRALLAAMGDPA